MDNKQKRKYFYLGLLVVHLYGYILSILWPFFINIGEDSLSIKEDHAIFLGALVWPWEIINEYMTSPGYSQWLVVAVVPIILAIYLFRKRKFIALGIITYVSLGLLAHLLLLLCFATEKCDIGIGMV